MTSGCARACLVSLMALALALPSFALDDAKWSRVENASKKNYVVELSGLPQISGAKLPFDVTGGLWIKKAGEPGDGTRMEKGSKVTLERRTTYLFYFETSQASIACQALKIGDHGIFILKTPGIPMDKSIAAVGQAATSDFIMLGANFKGRAEDNPISIAYEGFRNHASGTNFITIN